MEQSVFLEKYSEEIKNVNLLFCKSEWFFHENPKYYGFIPNEEPTLLFDMFCKLKKSQKTKFLDVGCGNGWILRLANLFGFQAIKGIENQEDVIQLTYLNYGEESGVIYKDALEYDYSSEEIIYLYRPIHDETLMTKLINKIVFETPPGSIIVYFHQHNFFPQQLKNLPLENIWNNLMFIKK